MASYDRVWELHLTGRNGFYDFTASIKDQRDYQLTRHPGDLLESLLLVDPTTLKKPGIIGELPIPSMGLPKKGYVATCLPVSEMLLGSAPQHRDMVAWINDPGHVGKLRVNSHGDGMGRIGMADGTGQDFPVHYVDADKLVEWLVASRLVRVDTLRVGSVAGKKNANGLITINLACCMGARHGTTPATMDWFAANSTPAVGSAAHKVAVALGKAGLTGVEVTASNEITMDGASAVLGQWGRVFGLGGNQTPVQYASNKDVVAVWDIKKVGTGVEIIVPDSWTINTGIMSAASISPPVQFVAWQAIGTTPSAGFKILSNDGGWVEVPAGWIVDQPAKKILPPLGFDAKSNGSGKGGVLKSVKDDTPFTGMGQRMARSITKCRAIA
jgi:hypothetical protein